MDYALELVLKYPLITLKLTGDSDVTLIEGKIIIENKSFTIILKQTTLIDGAQTYELVKLSDASSFPIVEELLKNLSVSHGPVEILDKIHALLQMNNQHVSRLNHCDTYRKVLHEYSEFTKFFLNLRTCKLQEDLGSITASILDSKSRVHHLEISVDYSQKTQNIFSLTKFDLPQTQDQFKPNDNLTALVDQFVAQVETLQPYFDLMDELDGNATILDPDQPKRGDAYRRIWLGDNISIVLTVDPFNIFHRPHVRFLGPDRLVDHYNSNLNNNLGNWLGQENLFQAVLDLLGLEGFDRRELTDKQVDLLVEYGECSICFSSRLNGKLPEIVCPNDSCEKFYHNQCLYEWLISLNAKRVFNNVSGNCPNCEKPISCPILD